MQGHAKVIVRAGAYPVPIGGGRAIMPGHAATLLIPGTLERDFEVIQAQDIARLCGATILNVQLPEDD